MSYISGNRFLSLSEMKTNATYIRNWFAVNQPTVTLNAICGMLGNMQTESTINSGIWQNLNPNNPDLGYGLVQWTPSTKYINWCTANGLTPSAMDSALLRIIYEAENNIQWGNDSLGNNPPYNFWGFLTSTDTPYNLAMLFLHHYERPREYDQPIRGTQANNWWSYLNGTDPDPPDPGTPKPTPRGRALPIMFYLRKF